MRLLGTLILFLSASFLAAAGDEYREIPPLLRSSASAGFLEFQFFGDGNLIGYEFSEYDLDIAIHGEVFPFLWIESWTWKREGGKVFLGRESPKLKLSLDDDGKYFMVGDFGFSEIKRLKFFDVLTKCCRKRGMGGMGPVNLPLHFVRTMTPSGFIEYEFCPDGMVLAYYDLENAREGDKAAPLDSNHTRFKIERLEWKRGKEITVFHGETDETFTISKDSKKIVSDRGKWEEVDHLEFFPKLYNYCGRSE
jgi:hypothetical protein